MGMFSRGLPIKYQKHGLAPWHDLDHWRPSLHSMYVVSQVANFFRIQAFLPIIHVISFQRGNPGSFTQCDSLHTEQNRTVQGHGPWNISLYHTIPCSLSIWQGILTKCTMVLRTPLSKGAWLEFDKLASLVWEKESHCGSGSRVTGECGSLPPNLSREQPFPPSRAPTAPQVATTWLDQECSQAAAPRRSHKLMSSRELTTPGAPTTCSSLEYPQSLVSHR